MRQSGDVCIGDLGVTLQEQQARFAELGATLLDWARRGESFDHLLLAQQGDRGDGGALVYVFDTPDGSLLYQDTSGHWSGILRDLRPDVAIVAAAGRGNIDGEPIQGSTRAVRRARGRTPRRRTAWCCRITTTGCPVSRSTPI